MSRFTGDSTVNTLIIAAVAAVAIAYFVPRHLAGPAATVAGTASATQSLAVAQSGGTPQPAGLVRAVWAASAPGRVEPKSGEIRISSVIPGRIAEILVAVNDTVMPGDLLVRLDAADLEARVAAADAEVGARRRERDQDAAVGRAAQDRRTGEDAVSTAERTLMLNRAEFDRWTRARRAGNATAEDLAKARDTVSASREQLDKATIQLRRLISIDNPSQPTRPEALLAAARAEYSAAVAAFERAHLRAPKSGTVMQLQATVGESTAPSPENVLTVIGDLTSLQVRAEIEERDVAKIRIGQAAVVRSDAVPGRDFEGKVTATALSLTVGRLTTKGPRKPTDVDVLDIVIDLGRQPTLMPGMRVDVFLKPDSTAFIPPKVN